MDEQEQTLFERLEKDTNHKLLMKLTEISAKISGILMILAMILLYVDIGQFGHPALDAALVSLLITLLLAISEEWVRRRIQNKVNRELEK
jgi:membrane-bound ClpP family serine protease